MHTQFNCFIVGSGSLLIQCAETVLKGGHELYGIVTPDASVVRWAVAKGIPCIAPTGDLRAFLGQRPFDYLLSIVNYHLLPAEILELPRKYAINYHDAPLPRYAGMHATSWALMEQAETHGVTWHVMSDVVDGGDILKQRAVRIDRDETALTLNAKCYEAAIDSFTELVADLSSGQAARRKQNSQERTYYPRFKRPAAGCVFSWRRRADELDAFVRALSFGSYPNPLGQAKLAVGTDFIIVPELHVVDAASGLPPGTISAIDDYSVRVSTASNDVELRQLLSIDGQALSIIDFAAKYGLHRGYQFEDLAPEPARRLTSLQASTCKHEDFWVERLQTPKPLALPYAARNLSSEQTERPTTFRMKLPDQFAHFVNNRMEGESAGDFLLAAYLIYLSRVSAVSYFDVGFRCKDWASEVAGLNSFFAPCVPLQVNLDQSHSFAQAVAAVQEEMKTVGARQTYARDVSSRYPSLRSTTGHGIEQFPLGIETVAELNGSEAMLGSKLTLIVPEHGKECWWAYHPEALDDDSFERMLRNFTHFLLAAVANPNAQLTALQLLSQQERHQILREWNETQIASPSYSSIHHFFQAQAALSPHATALIFHHQHLSYSDLNQRANQLAHYLQGLGVGPEVRVGICLDRSIEMVVSLLAILKAGGAYVPLDPQYPQERLSFMLRDAEVEVVLTHSSLAEKVSEYEGRTLCLDTELEAISEQSRENPRSDITAANLAYVIYTSGSTGQPKGVAIAHHSTLILLSWALHTFSALELSGVLASTSICFDLSVFELFVPLCAGGTVILAENALELPSLAAAQEVKLINTVPSAMAELVRSHSVPAGVVSVNLAGEALSNALVERIYEQERIERVRNLYGPTEDTTYSTYEEVERGAGSVTIGRGIANTEVYILDEQLNLVPVGVTGELYIGGDGLARGYLNRPELTAEKFVPHPYSREAGARLYKTGDVVRYRGDGKVEYLGRADEQVKVRGYRIELGEIETVLSKHSSVAEAVVIAREDEGDGNKRIVAYVVSREAAEIDTSELRSYLRERVPEYMIPNSFVFLESLPLTANGKVNKRALPAPEKDRTLLGKAYVAPRTPEEELLAGIWSEVLGVEQVGIDDNFFELGGDSILSIQIVAKARAGGLFLTPKQLFRHRTIAELLTVAERTQGTQSEQGIVVGPVPPTPIQHWLFQQNLPDPQHFNQAVLLEAQQSLDHALLEKAAQRLILHHDALRLRYVCEESGWRQENAGFGEAVPFSVLDLSHVAEAEQGAAIEAAAELQASLNLSSGPLLRFMLFELGPERPCRLLIVINHLAVDEVSWRILLEDLDTSYRQLSLGEPVKLPSKTTSFKEWSERLTLHAQSEALHQELDYWRSAPRAQSYSLPVDYPEGCNSASSSRTVWGWLGAVETQAMLREVPSVYHTQINDLLLTALLLGLEAWTAKRSLLIDLEGHGREEIIEDVDVSRTVGWFTSLFPVLLDLSDSADLGSALKSVKEQLRRIPNRGIGYGLLRYLSNRPDVKESLERLPRAELVFNYLSQFDRVLSDASPFNLTEESAGPLRSERGQRSHLLEINASVVGGQLRVGCTYSENVHRRSTIERLMQSFVEALRSLISHCQQPEAGGYTPSDFPLAGLSQAQLDRLAGRDRQIESLYPLSPMQQGMLYHTLYDTELDLYFVQLALPLQGRLNIIALKQAWQEMLERHTVLRTAYVWEGVDEPLQMVRRQVELPWEQHDWRGLNAPEQAARLRELLQQERHRSFKLSEAPLMRLSLVQLADDASQLIWSYHHLLLDGWSEALLLKELSARYEAICLGRRLQPETIDPYESYIGWLQRRDVNEAEQFWRRELKGFGAPIQLGEKRKPTDVAGQPSYEEQQTRLSRRVTSALESQARLHQVTMNTLVQGAWALLLSRYSGEDDIVYGVTVSGRPAELACIDSMIGLFINTLPVRVQVAREKSLWAWLKQLQAQQAEMRQYEHSSLAQVHQWSELPKGLPLFESLLVFENYPSDTTKQARILNASPTHFLQRTNYPLTVIAEPSQEFSLRMIHDENYFDGAQVTRLLGHLKTLLESMAANVSHSLSTLPFLTEAERHQLLVEWNDVKASHPPYQCNHELFEAQAERTPDAIAVVYEEEQISYRELNERANQLAHHLQSLGVGPEVRVGICLERSIEMMIGVLGTLKAGGAYVPLDPQYPQERLSFMLKDAEVRVVLTQNSLLKKISEYEGQTVCLDTDWPLIARRSKENPFGRATADNLAYVIYTSGSTGQPKAASMPHRALLNLILWHPSQFDSANHAVVLQFSSLSFDVSFQEMFSTWHSGSTLLLVSEEVRRDAEALLGVVASRSVSRIFMPFVALQQLAEVAVGRKREELSLREVITAGEQLRITPELEELFERLGECSLHNHYGPSETHLASTYILEGDAREWAKLPPIGRPINNVEMYVLDEEQEAVPVGVTGELYIGGDGLARGYLNRPEVTAERFVPHPYSREAGARLYRTGDVVRYRQDGNIEFIGRRDEQVKIRGYRIELGEIEAVLSDHSSVAEVVVIAREDVEGHGKRIVAYVVSREATEISTSELRSHLKQRLPEYMIPNSFVMMESLPLTANGKVDRRALPAPEHDRSQLEKAYLAPRTPEEELLAGIWSEVLGVEQVGIDDNFFELGGHSLLATQVISRIRESFQLELPLRTLFESPTLAALAASISAAGLAQSGLSAPAVVPVPVEGAVPLSFAQQRLWFIDQYEPNTAAFNIPAALRLRGPLNHAALSRSFTEIVRRHEALRTIFSQSDGQPVQLILPPHPINIPLLDLSASPDAQQEAERLASAEAQLPFNLSQGPLLRTQLLRLSEDEHVLLLNMHHIVSDGWSMGILIAELSALYRAFSEGAEESPLEELKVQYADFSVWQRNWLQGEVLEGQLEYWREQLRGAPAVLELPTDYPRPAVQSYRGAHQHLMLSRELSAGLKELSQREGVTLFMTLLAAFKVLLWRYTGAEDVVVGTPIANRNRAETEELIGYFVNTLVLRTEVRGGEGFREVLKRVREVTLGAYAHQDVPFEMLVEALGIERNRSHSPLFQVVFGLHNAPIEDLELDGLTIGSLNMQGATAKHDLTLHMSETEQGIVGTMEYSTDLFDASTIARMTEHLQALMKGITADPDMSIAELPLVSEEERQQLLKDWNNTTEARCIHEILELQAARTPDAVALVYEEEQLSYRELNERANQLAHYLQGLGVGPEVRVGICLDRSIEMVVSLLAILKAGGAYVPLDPHYPLERLSFMLADAQLPLLLSHSHLIERLPSFWGQLVSIDADPHAFDSFSKANPESRALPANLAYVIYTSGSTGQPKGVAVSHRGICNLAAAQREVFHVEADERVLQFASLSFDASVFEMMMAFGAGARLCLGRAERLVPGGGLAELMREEGVTNVTLPPSVLGALGEGEELGELRTVVVAGEACRGEVVERWGGGRKFYNAYGPTEGSVWATVYRCEEGVGGKQPPIGRAISNTEVYILDERMQVVPVGITGELYIGGDGLARGYLNRPEMTAERFVPHPYSQTSGARLYRTGDIVRYRRDGNIEFIGRRDEQVKVRGYRIELGEIEAVLSEHPSVAEVVVVAREDEGDGNKRIVAYVVARAGEELSTSELRSYLKEQVPEYMIPNSFVLLESLPLTANGKVDRRALPAPELDRSQLEKTYVAPRTPEEELLAGIWSEVLGVEQVGADDNFFELGGHSLLATQVVSRIREVFQVELGLQRMFEEPRLRGVAASIEELRRGGERRGEGGAIRRRGGEGAVPLSFAQQRLWFLDQLVPGNPFFNISAVVGLRGRLNIEALRRSFDEIVRRHEALRTTFELVDGAPVQIINEAKPLNLPVLNLGELTEAERDAETLRLATEEAQRPFNLTQGPLLRVSLLRVNEEEHVVLITMHHIVSDGWSRGIIVRELSSLYDAFSNNKPSALPELGVQYADFAIWQRAWLQGSELEKQLAYWKQQLEGAAPILELPADHPRPAVQTFRGATQSVVFSQSLSESIKSFSQREGATLFMTLLAAFKTLLYRYTGQVDISVGSPIANRNRSEIEELIGFFANTLVLRTDISGNPSYRELLRRVREVSLGAYAHQDLPFEKLVEEIQPQRNLSYNPLFQVMFVLQNVPMPIIVSDDQSLSLKNASSGTTKFDLTLSIAETEQGLLGAFEYNTDLFNETTINRMIEHFRNLLEGIVTDPDALLSALPLLGEQEQHQLTQGWNETGTAYPAHKCIHQLFEAQVEVSPDATAVVYEDEQVSYRELNERANQLAHYLQGLGVGPEVRVGICLDRSIEMVVSLLAILKAGGAYVPLDPQYPQERLSFMLRDAEVEVVLTHSSLAEKVRQETGHTLCLDTQWQLSSEHSRENLRSEVRADNLAYVIYTSGSTGQPKGVEVIHRSILRLLCNSNYVSLDSSQCLLQMAPLAFDASTFEVWGALLHGARLVLYGERVPSGEGLQRVIREQGVRTAWLTASLYNAIVDEDPRALSGLQQLLVGGEALSVRHIRRVVEEMGEVKLINGYGPTEATTFTTTYEIRAEVEEEWRERVPLGRPISNTEVYILDERMQVVPVGITGELYIGGDGLARGYLNRPELTAERFVPHPYSQTLGARLYKTGDVVRYRADGNIEFVGRKDEQVKVRGYRIELGEIEAVLSEHSSIAEVVVVAREDEGERKRIVAYVVSGEATEISTSELRSYLKERVPEYMIPSSFVMMESLPLTVNGKVDRRALPAPESWRRELVADYVMPRTEVERTIAAVWREVLGMEEVGIHDNFFDLGGHSLLVIRVHSKLREVLDKEVAVIDLFQYPTVSALAEYLERPEDGTPSFTERVEQAELKSDSMRRRRQLRQGYSVIPEAGSDNEQFSDSI